MWDSNRTDIKTFIEQQFKNRQFLHNQDDTSKRLAERIYDRLPEQAQGDYAKIQRALEKIDRIIDRTGTSKDIDEAIDEAGQTAKEMAAKDLESLEKQLSTYEIEELNELLAWLYNTSGRFGIDALEAVLYLRFDSRPYKKPLDTKIEGKYSKVLYIDEMGYVCIHAQIRDLITTSKRTVQIDDETPQISATITITKADITTVQNFLWKLCGTATIDQFQFANAASVQSKQAKIQVNQVEALIHVVQQSLALLLRDVDEKSTALVPDAVALLPSFLNELYELSKTEDISDKDREPIVRGVAQLLSEEVYVETYWQQTDNFIKWHDVSPFWKWLEDSNSAQHLEMKQKRWLAGIRKAPNVVLALLKPISTLLARNWLQDEKWDPEGLFDCLEAYLIAVGTSKVSAALIG
ncbi:hypothetical protein Dsin_033155 [Dipteronia sinensis]|uniref:Uncharacterized protein n=1 Tax=Dipteronia sinensis TaxID=43782 RepID=A0AAD9Z2W7_9ROSI|nr:hypothetical protein Dsin_033155 [Dipteronia sinensis]